MDRISWIIVPVVCIGCGHASAPKDLQSDDHDATDTPGEVADEHGGDQGSEDMLVAPVPWGPENRGYTRVRGVVHAHSIYSHDGCSPHAPPVGSPESLECLQQMRTAPCEAQIRFIMQSDHPGNVADTPFLDALHYDPQKGDRLMKDAQGRPFANQVTCPPGSLVDSFYFFVGTEGGGHNMPVAMAGPIPKDVFHTGYDDQTPLEQAQKAAQEARERGGVVLAAHTEQADVSIDRIVELPLDGMEIYNFHANAMEALSDISNLFALDRFMKAGGPDPDLALLAFLAEVPADPEKFDKAAPRMEHLVLVTATDVHRNVEIPQLCPEGLDPDNFCGRLAADYPNFAEFLTKGGPLPLGDGDRIDSYLRTFKWFSNNLWVQEVDADHIRKALSAGRGFASFDVFGYPDGFDFFAYGNGQVYELGEVVADGAAEVTFFLETPTLTAPAWRPSDSVDYSGARVTTKVIRATKQGSQVVREVDGQGMRVSFHAPGPGVYRVECQVVPEHLEPLLTGVEDLAHRAYPYLYSNAIFVR